MSCEESLSIEDEMIVYLSNLLAANLIENELLRESMRSFYRALLRGLILA